ncbi:MAG: hypothetical protein DI585_04455 [Pseudomonas fluorescens]|nr:MAG: hypothetical protein DI585_04455 [Pseudomonas fluorescens]
MDFVARAGAIIDRAHRVAGILLICVIILGIMSTCQFAKNSELQAQLDNRRIRYPVIVVPDATTGVYSPTEEDRLINLFADFITQSLNSYTPANIGQLYAGVRPFMSPAMLTDSEPYFQRKVRDSTGDRRSSFFVPDRSQQLKVEKRSQNGVEYRDVSMIGQINTIVGGTVAEGAPLEIQMTFQKTFASPANPYGFMLTKYYEKILINPNTAPQLPTVPR